MKKWQFMFATPSIVGSIILKNFMPLTPSIVETLCYVRGTPFFFFFFFEELYVSFPIYSGNTLLCARYPFFSFFFCFCFTPVLLLKNISAIMKNFSAIKRVVKHENMAIYVRYPLYSWKHLFNEQFFRFLKNFQQ